MRVVGAQIRKCHALNDLYGTGTSDHCGFDFQLPDVDFDDYQPSSDLAGHDYRTPDDRRWAAAVPDQRSQCRARRP